MADYKKEAAKAALGFIRQGHTIGLGAGSTVVHLADLIKQNRDLAETVTFVSSSFKTNNYLVENKLKVQSALLINKLDCYFDGCDQFDSQLNALKSGGGIHTAEKILAAMAKDFVLMGDEGKFVPKLNAAYPLVIEILPLALQMILNRLATEFPGAEVKFRMSNQKDGALISENGNFLADIHFAELPDLQDLNIRVKMIPGIVEHSLFYKMATKAIIAGENGVRIIEAPVR
ncbi:MAG TPA: ribose 5-phosphate isomerase A [Pedobacter sp.]|uniref:ribose 5-phosphate isomerase A n=1 Tax=Pedobacter sp. TaxID=1411316 RepID=UPI002C9082F4|nr:ribose 5-phosphate isomerase A [Pedobacter sp.]HMI01966.1 ribose 5-phosphate isomerase A [Pedobacter sp.]